MESDSDSYEEMEGGRRKMPDRLCKKGPAKEVSFLSGFESEICPDSSMASDSGNYEEREDERRKVADRLCKKGPSRDYRLNQKRTKNQLPVTCGEKEGILCLLKYNKVQPCILSEGQWFTPTEFERFGKKERNKKWKISIFYYGIPLQTFIEDGLLSSQHFKKSRFQTENEQCGRELSSSDSDSEHPTDAPEPAGSSVIEEADQTSEEQEVAADPINECQNPIDSQETRKTDQMQLLELLAKRFNTMNNALKSVDSSLKTFMEK